MPDTPPGGLLTRKEADTLNEDYAKTLASPDFMPLFYVSVQRDRSRSAHVSLITLQNYLDGWYPLNLIMEEWKVHFKECFRCASDFVFYEEIKIKRS